MLIEYWDTGSELSACNGRRASVQSRCQRYCEYV